MTALVALIAVPVAFLAFVAVGFLAGALILVAILVALVAASVVVGMIIGDAVVSIGTGRRRTPRVAYWSAP